MEYGQKDARELADKLLAESDRQVHEIMHRIANLAAQQTVVIDIEGID